MQEKVQCKFCGKTIHHTSYDCPFCGERNIPESKSELAICPRCHCELVEHPYREAELDICPKCAGLWVDISDFKRLTSQRDVYQDNAIPYEYTRKPLPREDRYLKCPLCDDLMVRRNFRKISGVLVDVCRHHGAWLDTGELEQIRSFIANGGLEKAQDKEILINSEAIKSLDTRLSDVEFMQKLLHHWKFKRWMFSK